MATRKSGGAKTTRTETVTVRLDPELRYLAEIAARVQRRTLSSYVEWAILESLKSVPVSDRLRDGARPTIFDFASELWDVDEADRFVRLAFLAPDLLNFDEQVLWKLIREYGYFWQGNWEGRDGKQEWVWSCDGCSIIYERVRQEWGSLKKIAAGDFDESILPRYPTEREDPDHIPF